jgi:Multicopper oxidase
MILPLSRCDVQWGSDSDSKILTAALKVDGVNHVPRTVGGFNIYAGQRYSVVLHANKAVRNYWIRGPMDLQHHSDNDNRMCLHLVISTVAEGHCDSQSTRILFMQSYITMERRPGLPEQMRMATPRTYSRSINWLLSKPLVPLVEMCLPTGSSTYLTVEILEVEQGCVT